MAPYLHAWEKRVRTGRAGRVNLASPAVNGRGSRPMNIDWTLRGPLPAELFGAFSVLRG
jgi:hypothetical protein